MSAKHTFIIHDLTDWSPSRRAFIIDFLSEELALSPDAVAMRMKNLPLILKDWVEDENKEPLRAKCKEFGIVAYYEGETLPEKPAPVKTTSEPQTATVVPEKPATNLQDLGLSLDQGPHIAEPAPAQTPSQPEVQPVAAKVTIPDLGLTLDEPEKDKPPVQAPVQAPIQTQAVLSAPPTPAISPAPAAEPPTAASAPIPSLGLSLDEVLAETPKAPAPQPTVPAPAEVKPTTATLSDLSLDGHEEPAPAKASPTEPAPAPTPTAASSAASLDLSFGEEEKPAETKVDSSTIENEKAIEQEIQKMHSALDSATEAPTPSSAPGPTSTPQETKLQAQEIPNLNVSDSPQISPTLDQKPERTEEELYDYSTLELPGKPPTPVVVSVFQWIALVAAFFGLYLVTFANETKVEQEQKGMKARMSDDLISKLLHEQEVMMKQLAESDATANRGTGKLLLGTTKDKQTTVNTEVRLGRSQVWMAFDVSILSAPKKLTPDQIVAGAQEPLWVKKFELEGVQADLETSSEGGIPTTKFNFKARARTYLQQGSNSARVISPIMIQGTVAPDRSQVVGSWMIWRGLIDDPKFGDVDFAEKTPDGDFRYTLQGHFEATAPNTGFNPESDEHSLSQPQETDLATTNEKQEKQKAAEPAEKAKTVTKNLAAEAESE
ncbi:hypothetical protein JNK13_03965 [bacterium]|nr:hypothetical protein [bacterium]